MIETGPQEFLEKRLKLDGITALPTLVSANHIPTLRADGRRDDTDAMMALIEGRPFKTVDGFCGMAKDAWLTDATIRIDGALVLDWDSRLILRNCRILARHKDLVLVLRKSGIDKFVNTSVDLAELPPAAKPMVLENNP